MTDERREAVAYGVIIVAIFAAAWLLGVIG